MNTSDEGGKGIYANSFTTENYNVRPERMQMTERGNQRTRIVVILVTYVVWAIECGRNFNLFSCSM